MNFYTVFETICDLCFLTFKFQLEVCFITMDHYMKQYSNFSSICLRVDLTFQKMIVYLFYWVLQENKSH